MQDIRQIILNETLKKPTYIPVTLGVYDLTKSNKLPKMILSVHDLPDGYFKVYDRKYKETKYILDRRIHRTEKDPKTGLTKWARKDYVSSLKCYMYEWRINGTLKRVDKHPNGVSYPNVVYDTGTEMWLNERGACDREEIDPNTGLTLPAYVDADGLREWFIDGKRHRIDGPAVSYDPKKCDYDNLEQYDQYYLDETKMTKEEWEKDPRVQKVLALKNVQDKDIKDDDFLRSFGKIL